MLHDNTSNGSNNGANREASSTDKERENGVKEGQKSPGTMEKDEKSK